MMMIWRHFLHRRLLSLLFLLPILVACAGMNRISAYDEETDKSLTTIQQKTDDFIVGLSKNAGSAEAGFDKSSAFYSELDQLLRRLEFRTESIPKNQKTIELVKNIRSVTLGEGLCTAEGGNLRDLHCISSNRGKGPSARTLELTRRNINQTISAALSLELAKKQGLEQSK